MSNPTPANAPAAETRLMGTPETARMLGVTPSTLATWRSRGTHKLAFLKVGAMVRYERADVQEFIAEHRRDPITGARYGVGRAWLERRNNARHVLRALVDAFHSHGHDIEVVAPDRAILPDGTKVALDKNGYLCVRKGDIQLPLIDARNALYDARRFFHAWEAGLKH